MASDDWDGLVSEYAEQNPAYQRDLERFAELNTPRGRIADVVERMSMAILEPDELRVPKERLSGEAPPKQGGPEYLIRG